MIVLFDPELSEIRGLGKVTLLSRDPPNSEPAQGVFSAAPRSDFPQFSVTRPHGQKTSSKTNKLPFIERNDRDAL